jgi:hypothetical protein
MPEEAKEQMVVKCTYLVDVDHDSFIAVNSDAHADVLVYVNHDLTGSGSSIVTAVRTKDRKHYNWVLSTNTTVLGLAEIADRFAKG